MAKIIHFRVDHCNKYWNKQVPTQNDFSKQPRLLKVCVCVWGGGFIEMIESLLLFKDFSSIMSRT